MEIKYFLNERNIKEELGVYVSASAGVLDLPKIKEPTSQNWREYHGTVVDLDAPRMEDREIVLDCFIKAESELEFIARLNSFYSEFLKSGFKRLRIEIGEMPRPLIFDTYLKEGIKVTKQWTAGRQVGKFQLKLIEPNPQKKVFRYTAAEPGEIFRFDFEAEETALCVTFGDNTKAVEISSDRHVVYHTYEKPGTYYISISGVISEIKSIIFQQQTETIWETI